MYKQAIVNNLIKLAGILDTLGSIPGGVRDNVVIPTGERSQSFAENAGYTLGELIGKPNDDNEDLGPYKDVVRHIKDTEVAEAYLRAAAKMRRKARILNRKREEDEGLRNSVVRSRLF